MNEILPETAEKYIISREGLKKIEKYCPQMNTDKKLFYFLNICVHLRLSVEKSFFVITSRCPALHLTGHTIVRSKATGVGVNYTADGACQKPQFDQLTPTPA